MILAGDIGGTKTVIALYESMRERLQQHREKTFLNSDYGSLEEILNSFLLEESGLSLEAACFGVAGIVVEGRSQLTNLAWDLDEAVIARAIGTPSVKLLNDLEAAAYGMLHLKAEELRVLHEGAQPKRKGNAAVIAAGTGLGEAILYWDGKRYHPIATEGGHCDFAPRTDQEIELLRYLQVRFGSHVSFERILSGPGFYSLYQFLRHSGSAAEPAWLTEKLRNGDPSATVTEAGVAGTDPVCVETLNLFSSIYGAEAGNLALKCLAVGGVFVGGGIAPRILKVVQAGSFMKAFTDKGRFSKLAERMEVCVALNTRAPLLGAANFAFAIQTAAS